LKSAKLATGLIHITSYKSGTIFIDGTNGLVFYDITELNAVVIYCDSESIEYWKYLIDI
jgi:hypothetical protein